MTIRTLFLTLALIIILSEPCFAMEPLKQDKHCSIKENMMLGYWKSAGDNGFFEEFLLDVDNSNHVFTSWLHQRPAVNGTWTFDNCVFQVFGTVSFTFHVISFKDKKITLIDEDENTTSVYSWTRKPDKL